MTTVRIDPADLARVQRLLNDVTNGAPRAMAAALNKTGAKAKTEGSKGIRQDIRLSAAYIRERINGPNDTPANKATFTKLEARITAPQRGLLLSHFLKQGTATPAVSGVAPKVKVKPVGRYQTVGRRPGNLSDSFLIRLRSNSLTGIAQRTTPGPRGGTIDVLHGPSLSQVLRDVKDDIMPAMQTVLETNLDNEVARILARIRA